MKPKKITAEMLIEKGAPPGCDEVIDFRNEWPDGAEVTLENLNRAAELCLSQDWFAAKFLSAPALEAYLKATVKAKEACQKVTHPVWRDSLDARIAAEDAYEKATAPALAACLKAIAIENEDSLKAATDLEDSLKTLAPDFAAYLKAAATATAAYRKAIATAGEAYEKAVAPAFKAYRKVTAPALLKAWQMTE